MPDTASPTVVGRYVLHAAIARGGMATIHLARLVGAEGFSRTVAVKRLHPQFLDDPDFLEMFLDEARIASKVHHPNVVPVLDVVQSGSEVLLVQEYVHGVPLDKLLRAARQGEEPLPIPIAVAVFAGMLAGLSAAHEACDELGAPLGIVHRDVSPQNVIVGVDGRPRLVDFGVAKAALSTHVTRAGVFKGKLGYSSPELLGGVISPSVDLYAAGVMLWEALAGRRLHVGLGEAELVAAVAAGNHPKLTDVIDESSVSPERFRDLLAIEPVVSKAMAFDAEDRHESAEAMAEALLAAASPATPAEVARWVKDLGREHLAGRERLMVSEESSFRERQARAERSTLPVDPPLPAPTPEPPATVRVSVLTIPPAPPPRAERPIAVGLILAAAVLGGVFILSTRSTGEPIPAAAPAAGPPMAIVPTATAAPAPTLAPAPSTSAAPSATAAAPSPRWPARPVIAPPVRPAPPADCDPPFRYEGKKKVFKPGCL